MVRGSSTHSSSMRQCSYSAWRLVVVMCMALKGQTHIVEMLVHNAVVACMILWQTYAFHDCWLTCSCTSAFLFSHTTLFDLSLSCAPILDGTRQIKAAYQSERFLSFKISHLNPGLNRYSALQLDTADPALRVEHPEIGWAATGFTITYKRWCDGLRDQLHSALRKLWASQYFQRWEVACDVLLWTHTLFLCSMISYLFPTTIHTTLTCSKLLKSPP